MARKVSELSRNGPQVRMVDREIQSLYSKKKPRVEIKEHIFARRLWKRQKNFAKKKKNLQYLEKKGNLMGYRKLRP